MFPVSLDFVGRLYVEKEGVDNPLSVEVFIDDFQRLAFLYQFQVLLVNLCFLPYLGESLVDVVCLDVAADASPASAISANFAAAPQN